jgi:cysteine desulfurase
LLDIIYLDHSAATRQYDSVTEEMTRVMRDVYGNPSSLHTMGVAAERTVKTARRQVAESLGVAPSDVYFTSGGTESNNLALTGAVHAARVKGVVTTAAEHKSVLEPLKNLGNTRYVAVDGKGIADLDGLERVIDGETALVSVSHVNSESGAVQPIEEISRIIKAKNPKTLLHVDAAQSYRKLPLSARFADLISVSAHKIHGPKGVGALYVRKGVKISPVLFGGGQENTMRSGTENTPAIAGFGVAAGVDWDYARVCGFNALLRGMLEGVVVNSADGSPYILNVSAVGIRSEVLLHALEQRGVIVSSGSACSSRRPRPSHVLTAMGLPRGVIDGSIRISFSHCNTREEISKAGGIINAVIAELRAQCVRG